MIAHDLVRHVTALGWPDTPVHAIDDRGVIYTITGVAGEPRADDGEGHVTSTGATVWLQLEEM